MPSDRGDGREGMESLIDDGGAKRKVRRLIANIGNYGTRGARGHLPSLRGVLFSSLSKFNRVPVAVLSSWGFC